MNTNNKTNKCFDVKGQNHRIAGRDFFELHLEDRPDCAKCMQWMMSRPKEKRTCDRVAMALIAAVVSLVMQIAVML